MGKTTTTLTLTAALLAGTAVHAQDKGVQGRPMGGLAMSEADEHAMEKASMDRGKPAMKPMHHMSKHHKMR